MLRTTTQVPCTLAPPNHCRTQSPRVTCQERVGGRAGTAAPKGAVCELPNPPISNSPPHPSHPTRPYSGLRLRRSLKSRENLPEPATIRQLRFVSYRLADPAHGVDLQALRL